MVFHISEEWLYPIASAYNTLLLWWNDIAFQSLSSTIKNLCIHFTTNSITLNYSKPLGIWYLVQKKGFSTIFLLMSHGLTRILERNSNVMSYFVGATSGLARYCMHLRTKIYSVKKKCYKEMTFFMSSMRIVCTISIEKQQGWENCAQTRRQITSFQIYL